VHWDGSFPALKASHIYDVTVNATDTVNNTLAPGTYVVRICTSPYLVVTATQPEPGSIVSGVTPLAFTVSDVDSGGTGSAIAVQYTAFIEENGTRYKMGVLNATEIVGISASRELDLDTRTVPDSPSAIVVVDVRPTRDAQVPLEFESATFAIANGAPTSAATFGGYPSAHDGTWLPTPFVLYINATSRAAKVGGVYVSSDNVTFHKIGCASVPSANGCLRFSTEGWTALYYYTVDTAEPANIERTHVLHFGIDTGTPALSVTLAGGASTVRTSRIVADIAASEAPSGVAGVVLRTGPSGSTYTFGADRLGFGDIISPVDLPAGQGVRWVDVVVTDNAGVVAEQNQSLTVDYTPPTVSPTFLHVGFTDAILRVVGNKPTTMVVLVKRTTDAAFQSRWLDSLADSHTVSITGLLPGTRYEAFVQLTDGVGNVANATILTTTAYDNTPPTAVTGLAVSDPAQGFLILDWNAATDNVGVVRYDVYRGVGSQTPTLFGYSDDTRFLDTNLTPGLPYSYEVRAEDAAGNKGPPSLLVAGRATTLPVLIGGTVTPTVGDTNTVYQFSVVVRDPDGRRPAFVHLVLNKQVHEMRPIGSQDPRKGVTYVLNLTLPQSRLSTGPNLYHFEASDGKHLVRSPIDQVGPAVAAPGNGQILTQATSGLFATFHSVPGAPVGVLLLGAAAAALLVGRRRLR
jgi:hypothetical protein